MIRVVCPACGAKGNAAEKLAGRAIPCPRCKTPLSIPASAAIAASPAKPDPDDEDQPYRLADEPGGNAVESTRSASSPFLPAGAAGPSVFERAGRRQSAPLETTGSATAAFAPVARKRKRRKRSEFEDPSAERRTLWLGPFEP